MEALARGWKIWQRGVDWGGAGVVGGGEVRELMNSVLKITEDLEKEFRALMS